MHVIARVVVDIKHEDVNQVFDYLIPEQFNQMVLKGSRVLVPFNTMTRLGYIIDLLDNSELATKSIIEVLDLYPVIDEEAFLMAERLLSTPKSLLASVYQTIVPNELLMHYSKRVKLINKEGLSEDFKLLFNQANHYYPTKTDFKKNSKLQYLQQKGHVLIETIIKPKAKVKKLTYIILNDFDYKATPKQQLIIDFVRSQEKVLKSNLMTYASSSIIGTLIKRDVLKVIEETPDVEPQSYHDKPHLELTIEEEKLYQQWVHDCQQSRIIALSHSQIKMGHFQYIMFDEILQKNQQIIYLVPEIDDVDSTKKQLSHIFKTTKIVSIHSDLTPKDKLESYQQFINEEALIVVGTRRAIFTPSSKLGLIYIDDSSHPSYLQEEQVYYDTIEIAKLRSKYHKIPLVLAAHTHRVDTINDIKEKRIVEYKLASLDAKKMDVIDMSLELKNGNASIFSQRLKDCMNDIIKEKQQAILVINQKGYAPFVMCRRCGYVPKDPMTQVPLTYYENEQLLKSNFRNYQEPYATLCPSCGKQAMKPVGFGVEFVESTLKKLYPNEGIARVDSSTMSNVKQRQATLEKVAHSSLIVGTELALKQVNDQTKLISILMADQFLQVPSYQAHEKAYRLLKELTLHEQIQTILQTYNPKHKILQYVIENQVDEFYKDTLSNRKLLGLPPYEKVAQVMLEGKSYLKTFQDAHYIKSLAMRYGINVLGPISSHIFKLKNLYRVIVTLKYQVMDQDVIDYINSYSNPDIKLSYYPGIKWN